MKRHPMAANVRALADAYVAAGQYQKASEAFSRAAAMYGKMGDPNAAKVLSGYSDRYRTSIGLFVDRPVSGDKNGLAKFEPLAGCYLGANIERDDETRDPAQFNERIGKHHAIFFMYRKYGVEFPKEYARTLREARCALQLAFEPSNLDEVQDDRYLRGFAEDARQSGIPVFLRYASEMNGDWTPYHGDPAKYIQKFRLVAKVMRETAPNVAMVWCPNEIPQEPIASYYPGPDAVDWVGVNFYSVIFNDADRSRGAEWRRPEDALDYIYKRYSGRHPIMVGEWAASHRSVVDNKERPDFAANKIAEFYSSIPRIYPRVKAVSWLSFDTFKYAGQGRQLNDYSLFNNPKVAEAYSAAVDQPYYLDEVRESASAASRPSSVGPSSRLEAQDLVSAYMRSYEHSPLTTFYLDKAPIAKFYGAGDCEFHLPRWCPLGLHALRVEVRDTAGRLAGSANVPVFIGK
ncbi:hypothetical protein OP10G_4649 [Fimbriimonas ginsengisoli Gsoil 348]|uniref:GH26 domain-containing protein n=1 Tax=Fimbriimonas ginsengisoli Gsoil 348 TaxID=661478 RepID=A0A068NXF4_FIMGI|nr:hypothetical protein OP10G_4649 [Fimbriimonas ginsengisoli Gsoil 348]